MSFSLRGMNVTLQRLQSKKAMNKFTNQALFSLRAFSTSTPTDVDPKKITDVEKLDCTNHDAAKKFGENTWKLLVSEAARKASIISSHRDVSVKASSVDTTMTPFKTRDVPVGLIHEGFRDLSKVDKVEQAHRFVDLFFTAVTMRSLTKRNKPVARWLFTLALMVFVMVVVGGLTRLTRSGLSMVHWKFTGEKRPKTPEEWEEEFAKYKASPEYKIHNQGMSLDEFKFIYHMEYGHRTLGRIIGLAFIVPYVYFLARKRIAFNSGLNKGLLAALSLGALQGGIGWWMVKSGLNEETNKVKATVSPYRLATHLITAFALFSLLTVLGLRFNNGKVASFLGNVRVNTVEYFQSYTPTKLAHALAMMTFVTAASGAFVAGNEAGLVYNEFPLMGGQLIPSDIIDPYIKPAWKNWFENSTAVQFIHRCLAITTWSLAMVTAIRCRLNPTTFPGVDKAAHHVAMAATAQAGLGISTLLAGVPIELAACHQAGAMVVLFTAIRLMFVSRNPELTLKNVSENLEYAEQTNTEIYQQAEKLKLEQEKKMQMYNITQEQLDAAEAKEKK